MNHRTNPSARFAMDWYRALLEKFVAGIRKHQPQNLSHCQTEIRDANLKLSAKL